MQATSMPHRILRELTPSEADFQARVIRLGKAYGFLCYHTFNSRRSEKGMPDLLLLRPPRLVFAELKVWPRTTLRPEQALWIERLRAVPGIEVYVWAWEWPGDVMDDVVRVLSA